MGDARYGERSGVQVIAKRKILVTGGAGFIGSHFVRMILKNRGASVVVLDKLTYAGNRANLADVEANPRFAFVHGDIADKSLVDRIFQEDRPQAVVNFAAETHVDRSIDGPEAFVQTNVMGTFQLLEGARRYWDSLAEKEKKRFRFLQVSTDEVFGSIEYGAATEGSPYAPSSPYAASKAAADHLVRSYFRTYGLPTLITHSVNNFGPYQFPEKLIPRMILNALKGDTLPIYGDGSQVRQWIHAGDNCSGILAVLTKGLPGESYNISGKRILANIGLIDWVCSILDELVPTSRSYSKLIEFVTDRPGHDQRYALNAGKIKRELGWETHPDFGFDLRDTVKWYLDHRDWCEDIRIARYRGERLGLGI